MTPGKTKWAEVLENLATWGLLYSDPISKLDEKMMEIHIQTEDLKAALYLYRQNMDLSAIQVTLEEINDSTVTDSTEYEIRNLLSQYGAPTTVDLSFVNPDRDDKKEGAYHLWVNYAYLGFEIENSAIMDGMLICPDAQRIRQDIYAFTPGSYFEPPWGDLHKPGRFSLDQSTSPTLEDFIRATNRSNDMFCLIKRKLY